MACVAIDNSVNAAQLAARILASRDARIRHNLERHLEGQTRAVDATALKLETLGFDGFSNRDG